MSDHVKKLLSPHKKQDRPRTGGTQRRIGTSVRRKKRENPDISKVTFVNYEHKSLTAKQADVAKEQQESGENNRVLISRGTTAAFPWSRELLATSYH